MTTASNRTKTRPRLPTRSLEIRDDLAPPERPTDPDLVDQKEIVANGAYFHLERMSDDCVWIGLQVGRRFLHINLWSIKKGFLAMRVEEEDHDDL